MDIYVPNDIIQPDKCPIIRSKQKIMFAISHQFTTHPEDQIKSIEEKLLHVGPWRREGENISSKYNNSISVHINCSIYLLYIISWTTHNSKGKEFPSSQGKRFSLQPVKQLVCTPLSALFFSLRRAWKL